MSLNAVAEIGLFALLAVVLAMLDPEGVGLSVLVVLLGYTVLSVLSAKAFHTALASGHVKGCPDHDEGRRKAYFIAEGCPDEWLVRRYIRTVL